MYSFSSWFMPGHRLVQDQEARLGHQRARQFDPLLQAERDRVDQFVAHALQLQEVDHLLDLRAVGDLLGPAEPGVERGAQDARPHVDMAAEQDVVEHRHAVEQGQVLEGARDAQAGDLVRRERR